jgi:AMMECR1 domain-containing protein
MVTYARPRELVAEGGTGRARSRTSAQRWTSSTAIGAALLKRARAVTVATIRQEATPDRSLKASLIPVPIYAIGVTLYRTAELGCSVSTQPDLDAAVVEAAVAAATDRRFPRIPAREWRKIRVVVSVLYQPRGIGPCRKATAARHVRLGRDSVMVSKGTRRALFLDYVATQQSWTRLQLVSALLRKAGLRDAAVQWTLLRTVSWPP